jgi:hypothetical protein
MAGLEHWDVRPDGNVLIGPVMGWKTAIMPMTAMLRIQYAYSEDQFRTGGEALQMALTAAQARSLSEDLRQIADRLDADTAAGGTKQ